ncbi:MAG: hypothetical protein CMH83_08405 [Nocardioides sp.]|nr:hypothetical protein [Nocardioides sp.]
MSSVLRSPSPRSAPSRGARSRAADAVARARLAVVPRVRRRAPRVPFVSLVSILLLAGVVGLLLFNTSLQQASFTATQLEDQADRLSARQQALAMELDALRDPQQLARSACSIGMVVGPTAAFLDLDTGAVSGEPQAAVAGPCGIAPRRPTYEPPTAAAAATRPEQVPVDTPQLTTDTRAQEQNGNGSGNANRTGDSTRGNAQQSDGAATANRGGGRR